MRIDSAADLEHLHELDQKLWSVLGCPTSGLEFDTRTLQMLDSDGDGQIRSPEIIAATRWITTVLKDASLLFTPGDSVPLDAIDTSNPEGAKLASSARQIITYLGLGERKDISVAWPTSPSSTRRNTSTATASSPLRSRPTMNCAR